MQDHGALAGWQTGSSRVLATLSRFMGLDVARRRGVPATGPAPAVTPGTVAAADRPDLLCVDMDGTLVRTDTLYELLFACMRRPAVMMKVPVWLWRGKAHLKAKLAEAAGLDVASLPINQDLVAWLAEQRAAGRRIVLTTAADRRIADAVAARLGVFDDVIASDGRRNLRGAAKVQAIREAFPGQPFAYVGNDHTDLHVWAAAATAVIVNAPPKVSRACVDAVPVEAVLHDGHSVARGLLKAARPHQWTKNLLVFVPLITANALFEPQAWGGALLMFLAFCATASAIYMVNDLTDLAADRRHRSKRRRPFAAGVVPLQAGMVAVPVLLALGGLLAWAAGTLYVIVGYAVLTVLYSIRLKTLPLVDLFTLAALYTIRLFGGGEAAGYSVSLWLLAFSSFLFLGLAIVKRTAELMAGSPEDASRSGRGYLASDLGILQLMGVSSSFMSSMVLALYVQSDLVEARYASPGLFWLIVPLVLFWQCRIWLATARGYMDDDPIVYAARDWVSWLVALSVVTIVVLAHLPLL